MKKRYVFIIFFVALFAISACDKQSAENPPAKTVKAKPISGKVALTEGDRISQVAEMAVTNVVNISSTRTVKNENQMSPLFNDPFFRRFFGPFEGVPKERRERSLGSGVVVSENGYILTNNHVVKDAEEIAILTSEGEELTAEIIGTDPKSDLAVIKVKEKDVKLPAIAMGDSEALKLGQIVLAVGNPFGLTQTVTMGIISATGRANLGIVDYENFIQTDAAINPGNSGGALVNLNGELVGINTAIYSRSGGYQGIGFAIPINMAKKIMDSLIQFGKIERGYLGVYIQDVKKDLADAFGLDKSRGALVSDVMKDSPAEQAGIKRGDIILEMDGQEILDAASLRNQVAQTEIGKSVPIKLIRNKKEMNLKVKILKSEIEDQGAGPGESETSDDLSGLAVTELTPVEAQALGIDPSIQGVLVKSVEYGSSAEQAGLKPGDIIMEINREPVASIETYNQLVKKYKKEKVLLLVNRKGSVFFAILGDEK